VPLLQNDDQKLRMLDFDRDLFCFSCCHPRRGSAVVLVLSPRPKQNGFPILRVSGEGWDVYRPPATVSFPVVIPEGNLLFAFFTCLACSGKQTMGVPQNCVIPTEA
jgi:hypothetical protein